MRLLGRCPHASQFDASEPERHSLTQDEPPDRRAMSMPMGKAGGQVAKLGWKTL
jgi:hypothetical protein